MNDRCYPALLTALLVACGGPEPIETISLGQQTISADLTVGPLTFELPKRATSAIFWCEGYADGKAEVTKIVAPDGSVYLDAAVDQTLPASPANNERPLPRGYRAPELTTAQVPSSPDLPMQGGEWQVSFTFDAPGTARCGATVRNDEPATDAVIGVEIIVTGAPGLSAEIAPNDPAFQVTINSLAAMLRPHGLTLDVRYRDFTGPTDAFSSPELVGDDDTALRDLVRRADPFDDRNITVFLVDRIVQADFPTQTVPGYIVGPVGDAGRSGSARAGFVLSGATYRTDSGLFTNAFAHKLGHYLGLHHTTERTALLADPLADTAICGLENDANGNGAVNAEECVGLGLDNAMWWSLARDPLTFTADQGWVMRQSPAAVPTR